MDFIKFAEPITIEDDEMAGGGFYQKEEESRLPKKMTSQPMYRLHELLLNTNIKILTDPFQKSLAESNLARCNDRMTEGDEVLERRIAFEETMNGVDFHRTKDRQCYQNEGVVNDFMVLIKCGTFPNMSSSDLFLIIAWYRLGRNWWGHNGQVSALRYIRHYYTAMILLTGPDVLNTPALHNSLKNELRFNNLPEVPLAELRITTRPKP